MSDATAPRRDAIPILMVAEKFPPHARSGTARPLYFARHLSELGYRPVVLAAPVLDGEPGDSGLLAHLPPDIEVCRPAPLLTMRAAAPVHLNAAPDTTAPATRRMHAARDALWQTLAWLAYWHLDWLPPAFVSGVRLGRRRGVRLVWMTAPHVRNLVLGYALARALRRPLVVDLRDPWTYGSLWQPPSRAVAALERAWARTVLDAAALVVFTSPFTAQQMAARFPRLAGKSLTITNGFSAEDDAIAPDRSGFEGRLLLRHCGVLHDRRRPDVLLRGLALALERDPALRASIHLELVGDLGGNDAVLERFAAAGCVSARGRVSRRESLALMRGADVNILLQTISTGTDVIAGKTFDYLAARRPILGIVDPHGGDAWLLRATGNTVVSYRHEADIADAITALHARWRCGALATRDGGDLAAYERRHLTAHLARAFDRLLGARPLSAPVSQVPLSARGERIEE